MNRRCNVSPNKSVGKGQRVLVNHDRGLHVVFVKMSTARQGQGWQISNRVDDTTSPPRLSLHLLSTSTKIELENRAHTQHFFRDRSFVGRNQSVRSRLDHTRYIQPFVQMCVELEHGLELWILLWLCCVCECECM